MAGCVLQVHRGILHRLEDPARGRVRGGAQDAGASAGVLDDGQDVPVLPIESDGLDEIAGTLAAQHAPPQPRHPLLVTPTIHRRISGIEVHEAIVFTPAGRSR